VAIDRLACPTVDGAAAELPGHSARGQRDRAGEVVLVYDVCLSCPSDRHFLRPARSQLLNGAVCPLSDRQIKEPTRIVVRSDRVLRKVSRVQLREPDSSRLPQSGFDPPVSLYLGYRRLTISTRLAVDIFHRLRDRVGKAFPAISI
jgi:hypothetical protein